MFAIVGQVERPYRGREAFQEIDQVATLGGLAKWAAEPRRGRRGPRRDGRGDPPGPRRSARARSSCRWPRTCSMSRCADERGSMRPGRPSRARPTRSSAPSSNSWPRRERPVILAGAGVLRARTSTELTRFAELLQVPVIAGWRRGDVISNDHPLYLGMAGFGAAPTVRERLDAADALLVIGSRLNEPTTYGYAVPREGLAWAHVDLEPGGQHGLDRPRRSRSPPTRRRSSRRPTSGCSAGPCSTRRSSPTRQAHNAADRAAWEAASAVDDDRVGRPGRPSGARRSRRSAGSCPTTRS